MCYCTPRRMKISFNSRGAEHAEKQDARDQKHEARFVFLASWILCLASGFCLCDLGVLAVKSI